MKKATNLAQLDLFDVVDDARRAAGLLAWQAPEPPDLSRHKDVIVDFETNGLKWHAGDRPVGMAIRTPADGKSYYLPFAHGGGGNLDEDIVKRWATRELRDKRINNIKTDFDLHMSEVWGVDLRTQGNTFSDVAHSAALLDDHRYRFNLDELSEDLLGIQNAKVHVPIRDKGAMWTLPAAEVASYAMRDVELVDLLEQHTHPLLVEQDLLRVKALEDDVIPVVVEMERNGSPLNTDLLMQWDKETQAQLEACLYQIHKMTGVRLEPSRAETWKHLFDARGHAITTFTKPTKGHPVGQPSFADDVLSEIAKRDPAVQLGRHARNLASIRSRYITNYLKNVGPDGIIRYNLHQLAYSEEDAITGEVGGGTVSGRFSASNINPQQVMTEDKHLAMRLMRFYIRRLFVPGAGQWLSADARQIEYRLFAHYSGARKLIAPYFMEPLQRMVGGKLAWIQGPLADFHAVVMEMLQALSAGINRKDTKCVNFAQIYGAGLVKFAVMLGVISQAQADALYIQYGGRVSADEPLLAAARSVRDAYHRMFPQVKPLLRLASSVAKPSCDESCEWGQGCGGPHRGFVHTYLGRRARFNVGDRFYSALCRVISGSAADINKRVLVEVYKERKRLELMMRLTVHDELDCDLLNPSKLPAIKELLNTQWYPLSVPILWDVGVGANWAEAH